jgi:cytoskeletal protein CcmA (bactofilin family)
VGGSLATSGDLALERLEIGGIGQIDGSLTGGDVEVGGVLTVRGGMTLRGKLEVGGTVSIGEALTAEEVEVGDQSGRSAAGDLQKPGSFGRLVIRSAWFATGVADAGTAGVFRC